MLTLRRPPLNDPPKAVHRRFRSLAVRILNLFRISKLGLRGSTTITARQAGATLVEVLVAVAISGIMLPALATAVVSSQTARPATAQQLGANALLHEATEAVRSVRESGWSNITSGTFHPVISGTAWTLASGSEAINGYSRQIVISGVQRNSSGTIVSSGGTADPSTMHVVATVSWTTPYSSSVSTDSYLSRWRAETAWTQTTQSDFNAGTLNNVTVTNTAGGEVQLNGGGSGISWASPTVAGKYNISGTTAANDVYVDTATSRAYVVNGAALSIIDVSNVATPTLLGTYTAGVQLNGVYVVGNYAYIVSSATSKQFSVINVSTPSAPTLAGSLTLGDTASANSVYVSGNYAYVGKTVSNTTNINEFYIVNVQSPTAPAVSGSLNLTGTINSVCVRGSYAYLATAIGTAELTVINVSTPSAPVSAGVYNAVGTAAANDVYCGSTYVYLGEAANASGAEFFILDPSNPASVSLVGSYEVGANVYGVAVSGTEAFLLTAANNKQFTVLDTTTPTAPVVEGAAKITAANDIYVANNYAYLASTDTTGELTIMQGSSTSGGQSASGTYESPTFDSGSSAGFNYFGFTVSQPTNTTVTFQIAANNDNATWSYVGPDGTGRTSYSAPGAVPLSLLGTRYFRYKSSLSTTSKSVLPIIYDVTLDYSP